MKKSTLIRLFAAALMAFSALSFAQTYPISSPVYQPNAQLAAQSLTATGTTTAFTVQGVGTVVVRVSGSGTGIVGKIEGTNDLIGGSQTWSTIAVFPMGGAAVPPSRSITANGLYRISSSGYTQVRFNLTSLSTGTLTVRMVGAPISFTPVAETVDLGAVVTFASQAAATVNAADITNLLNKGIYCSLQQSATSGSPITTYSIQAKDNASGQYVTLLTSPAITSTQSSTPVSIVIFPGAANSVTSTNMQLPATWRISTTVGGSSTPIVSGTIGCQLLP